MSKKDTSPKVHQRDKFKDEITTLREFPWTNRQQEIIDCILSKKTQDSPQSRIVMISGRAGSGKSLISAYCGIKLLSQKKLSDYIFIRSPLECSDSAGMGYIKGDISQKFEPYVAVIKEKFNELLSDTDTNKLFNDNRIHFQPINYIRGMGFNVKYIHVSEGANLTMSEYKLLLTRYGEYSKLIIEGDHSQTDLHNGKRGAFKKIYDLFDNSESREKGIYCFELGRDDVKRSSITNYIIDKLESIEETNKK